MDQNLMIAEKYYQALGEKNTNITEKYLHADVQCVGPLVKVMGKESVLEANKKFVHMFKTLKIRSAFASGEQQMIVYDLECLPPFGLFSAAALLTLRDNLIFKIELFYDARPFGDKDKNSTGISIKKSGIGQFKDGLGVFANRDFKKGEHVLNWNLKTLTEEEYRQLPEYEKENFCHRRNGILYLYPDPERHVNRSPNPNVFPDFDKEADIALRDIKNGEEISILDTTQEDF